MVGTDKLQINPFFAGKNVKPNFVNSKSAVPCFKLFFIFRNSSEKITKGYLMHPMVQVRVCNERERERESFYVSVCASELERQTDRQRDT